MVPQVSLEREGQVVMSARGVLRLVTHANGRSTMELDTDLEGFLRELAVFQRAHQLPVARHFWLRKLLAGWRRTHRDSMHLKRDGRGIRTKGRCRAEGVASETR